MVSISRECMSNYEGFMRIEKIKKHTIKVIQTTPIRPRQSFWLLFSKLYFYDVKIRPVRKKRKENISHHHHYQRLHLVFISLLCSAPCHTVSHHSATSYSIRMNTFGVQSERSSYLQPLFRIHFFLSQTKFSYYRPDLFLLIQAPLAQLSHYCSEKHLEVGLRTGGFPFPCIVFEVTRQHVNTQTQLNSLF